MSTEQPKKEEEKTQSNPASVKGTDEKSATPTAASEPKKDAEKPDGLGLKPAPKEQKKADDGKGDAKPAMEKAAPKPSIGRIVHYKVSSKDHHVLKNNGVAAGEILPAIITRVWPNLVNLKIFTDGQENFWHSSISQGDEPGQWNWPARV